MNFIIGGDKIENKKIKNKEPDRNYQEEAEIACNKIKKAEKDFDIAANKFKEEIAEISGIGIDGKQDMMPLDTKTEALLEIAKQLTLLNENVASFLAEMQKKW